MFRYLIFLNKYLENDFYLLYLMSNFRLPKDSRNKTTTVSSLITNKLIANKISSTNNQEFQILDTNSSSTILTSDTTIINSSNDICFNASNQIKFNASAIIFNGDVILDGIEITKAWGTVKSFPDASGIVLIGGSSIDPLALQTFTQTTINPFFTVSNDQITITRDITVSLSIFINTMTTNSLVGAPYIRMSLDTGSGFNFVPDVNLNIFLDSASEPQFQLSGNVKEIQSFNTGDIIKFGLYTTEDAGEFRLYGNNITYGLKIIMIEQIP